jgi:hypothetical protein
LANFVKRSGTRTPFGPLAIARPSSEIGKVLVLPNQVWVGLLDEPGVEVWSVSFEVMQQFMADDVDESNIGIDIDEDVAWPSWQIDAVKDIESGFGWRNWSKVSPEGSLNFFPDSRKSVRQFNGFTCAAPLLSKFILYRCSVQCDSWLLVFALTCRRQIQAIRGTPEPSCPGQSGR